MTTSLQILHFSKGEIPTEHTTTAATVQKTAATATTTASEPIWSRRRRQRTPDRVVQPAHLHRGHGYSRVAQNRGQNGRRRFVHGGHPQANGLAEGAHGLDRARVLQHGEALVAGSGQMELSGGDVLVAHVQAVGQEEVHHGEDDQERKIHLRIIVQHLFMINDLGNKYLQRLSEVKDQLEMAIITGSPLLMAFLMQNLNDQADGLVEGAHGLDRPHVLQHSEALVAGAGQMELPRGDVLVAHVQAVSQEEVHHVEADQERKIHLRIIVPTFIHDQ